MNVLSINYKENLVRIRIIKIKIKFFTYRALNFFSNISDLKNTEKRNSKNTHFRELIYYKEIINANLIISS